MKQELDKEMYLEKEMYLRKLRIQQNKDETWKHFYVQNHRAFG